MKTKAKVILTSENTSLFAAETQSGDFAVVEVLDCTKIRVGDLLIGYWTDLDNQVVYDESHDHYLRVFVHDYGGELEAVQQQYFNPLIEAIASLSVPPPQNDDWSFQQSGFASS